MCAESKNKKRKDHIIHSKHAGGDTYYWITSNLLKHVKNVHKQIPTTCHKNSVAIRAKEKKHTQNKSDAPSTIVDIMIEESRAESIELHDCIEEINVSDASIEQAIDPVDLYTHSDIYNQVSGQIIQMDISTSANGLGPKLQEMMFKCNDLPITIKIFPIPGNGSCLFASISHQLYASCQNIQKQAADLRVRVVHHIRSNYAQFAIALKARVLEEHNAESMYASDDEAHKIIDKLLDSKFFGGSETLLAVYQIFKCNILIIMENDGYYDRIRYCKQKNHNSSISKGCKWDVQSLRQRSLY